MNSISWDELKGTLAVGTIVQGIVIKHEPYGICVDINYGYDGLVQITDFKDKGRMTPEKYPKVGSLIRAKVLGFKDNGCQIWLGLRPSQLIEESPRSTE